MPGTQLQIVHIDFTECKKKHQENQYRLYNIDGMSHKGLGRCKKRDIDIHKVQNDSHCHGYGQCPIFTKTY